MPQQSDLPPMVNVSIAKESSTGSPLTHVASELPKQKIN